MSLLNPVAPNSYQPTSTAYRGSAARTVQQPSQIITPAPVRRLHPVSGDVEARGFVLYVGLDELQALTSGTDLTAIVKHLKKSLAEIAPDAETHAVVALAPAGIGGRDVDVVRRALKDPSVVTEERPASPKVVIDASRGRITINGQNQGLTYLEFQIVQHLVERAGETISRDALIDALWPTLDENRPNARTVDVHIRRLRGKLAGHEDIIRTVRGLGYRFNKYADVEVLEA